MITSKRNPLVRKLRSLLKKTGREEHSSLLLEGSHLLEEALKTNFLPTEVIATPEWCDEHEQVLKKIASRSLLTLVTKNVLEVLSEWLKYRETTVKRRLGFRLEKIIDRLHILEGLMTAYLSIDEVIDFRKQNSSKLFCL